MSERRGRPGTALARVAVAVTLVTTGCLADSEGEASLPLVEAAPEDAASSTTTTEDRRDREFYTVQRGDTLITIARRLGTDLNTLVRENNIADPTKIYVGQLLLIPLPPDEDRGPALTIPEPTNPRLPPVTATVVLPTPSPTTTSVTGEPLGSS